MAAAVADFTPERSSLGKLARAGSGGLELRLSETEDIIAGVAADRTPDQTLVGFAAEHGAEAISRAREKLVRKGLDAIVFNDVSRSEIGFDSAEQRGDDRRGGRRARSAARLQAGHRRRHPRSGGPVALRPTLEEWLKPTRTIPLLALHAEACRLLEDGDFAAGRRPAREGRQAGAREGSVREALGRAYFRSAASTRPRPSSRPCVESHPVNDYAHFCLGRALTKCGERDRARHHLALASNLRPDRRDYRLYRDRLRAASPGCQLRAVVQRVSQAAVDVEGDRVAQIGPGLLVLLGRRARRHGRDRRPPRRQAR